MNKTALKIIGIIAVLILVANVFLFAFRIINWIIFWVIIILGGIFVWKVLPRLRKQ